MENFKCNYNELKPIEDLIKLQNPNNNNEHPDEQIEKLAKIISFQGQRSPIVISNRSGLIVKGHGRLLAMKKLGWKEAAVEYQDYLDHNQEFADMTADNEVARHSTLNINKFLDQIKDFEIDDIDLLGLNDIPALDFSETKVEFDGEKKINHEEHWQEMPEFNQQDKTGFRSIIVHFETEDDLKKFFETIDQSFTKKTKSIWFPAQERMDTESKRYE